MSKQGIARYLISFGTLVVVFICACCSSERDRLGLEEIVKATDSEDPLGRPVQDILLDRNVSAALSGGAIINSESPEGWTIESGANEGTVVFPVVDFGSSSEDRGTWIEWDGYLPPETVEIAIQDWRQDPYRKESYFARLPREHIWRLKSIRSASGPLELLIDQPTVSPGQVLLQRGRDRLRVESERKPEPGDYSYTVEVSDEARRTGIFLSFRSSPDARNWSAWELLGSDPRWQPVPCSGARTIQVKVQFRGVGGEAPVLGSVRMIRSRTNRPNIVFVLADTLRADRLGCYGNRDNLSPHIDSLAATGLLFQQAVTKQPLSAPAYASIYTGLPSYSHGITENGQTFAPSFDTLTKNLREAGYVTYGVVANVLCSELFGYADYFDRYISKQDMPEGIFAEQINRFAWQYLDEHLQESSESPFYLFLSYMDTHNPYRTPDTPKHLSFRLGEQEVLGAPDELLLFRRRFAEKRLLEFQLKPGPNEVLWSFQRPDGSDLPVPEQPYEILDAWATPSEVQMLWVDPETGEHSTEPPGAMKKEGTLILHNTKEEDIKAGMYLLATRNYETQEVRFLYDETVRYLDTQIGALINGLRERRLMENTIFVFVADHGEELGEHNGVIGHGAALYDSSVRVPLILSGTGLPQGRQYSRQVCLTDLAPTLLEWAGAAPLEDIEGISLVPGLFSETDRGSGRDYVLLEAYDQGRRTSSGVRSAKYKVIREERSGSIEFYDLAGDRQELDNVHDEYRSKAKDLAGLIETLRTEEGRSVEFNRSQLGAEEMEYLRGLGYTK